MHESAAGLLPRARVVSMPGYHLIVHSASFAYRSDGQWERGYLYCASTPAHRLDAYDVYTCYNGPRYYLDDSFVYHGVVSNLRVPVPEVNFGDWEIAYFFGNYHGSVDVYTWSRRYPPTQWGYHEALNICNPRDWWLCDLDYRWPVVWPALSRRQRRRGMRQFYRLMR